MNKGFTLIETLVAIAIMMLAVAGPLTIAHKGVQSGLYARDQVIAYNLSQDAIEYIRMVRDSNVIANSDGSTWLNGLGPCLTACKIETTLVPGGTDYSSIITLCPAGTCPEMKYDTAGGIYTYTTGNASGFTRLITMSSPAPNNQTVKVTIFWGAGVFIKKFEVTENLMNTFAP